MKPSEFIPAKGCTDSSDFLVKCFVARLRTGILVTKYGRSNWSGSCRRVLHIHSNGQSLSWKRVKDDPSISYKEPPKLDLATCLEVRHAASPDPLDPIINGTPILRSKCKARDAFKSFALVFPTRTVDITAVSEDQCKVLMQGFSALCFRIQLSIVARTRLTGIDSMLGKRDNELIPSSLRDACCTMPFVLEEYQESARSLCWV